jgi:hypothetical protein
MRSSPISPAAPAQPDSERDEDRSAEKRRSHHRPSPRWQLTLQPCPGTTHDFLASRIGVLLLFLWSVAFFYHLCNGIRHLVWDAGLGLRSERLVVAATLC